MYQKMEPKAKAAWLMALRSGAYKQGQGYLRSKSNKFCCLGVLCDLGAKKDWQGCHNTVNAWQYSSAPECNPRDTDSNDQTPNTFPPHHVVDRANLDMVAMDTLAKMNDDGESFADIADWIEKNL